MPQSDIHKALIQIRDTFPKSSKLSVFFIEHDSKTGAFTGSTQRAAPEVLKSAWQLEGKSPMITFPLNDEGVIAYVQNIAAESDQHPRKVLVVIDENKTLISVWVLKNTKCFIATAAFGSPLQPDVVVLSRYRDERLLSSRLGRLLLSIYEAVSPTIARWIDKEELFRVIIRKCLLPFVWFARLRLSDLNARATRGEEMIGNDSND